MTAEASDLYDDVLTGSVSRERKFSEDTIPLSKNQPTKEESKPAILYTYSGVWNKRLAVYVGNFSWVSLPPSPLPSIQFANLLAYVL